MNIVNIIYCCRNRILNQNRPMGAIEVYNRIDQVQWIDHAMNVIAPWYYKMFPAPTLQMNKRKHRIIASVTTIPSRISKTSLAMESMFRQSIHPDKVILWLGKKEFSDITLPTSILRLQKKGLEIRYVEDVGVHTKYYYVLQEFHNDFVITFDDDVFYPNNTISGLLKAYRENPGCVCAHWVWQMKRTESGKVGNRNRFRDLFGKQQVKASHDLVALGVGGVLYPPRCLTKETFNIKRARELTPTADDIWLKGMELLSKRKVAKVREDFFPLTIISDSQSITLSAKNDRQGMNNVQMKNLFSFYKLEDSML